MIVITSQITPRLSGPTPNAVRNLLGPCSPVPFSHHSCRKQKTLRTVTTLDKIRQRCSLYKISEMYNTHRNIFSQEYKHYVP